MLVCSSMADEPMEELGGRTPLEVAKTPFMDSLAKNGRVGTANFVPHSLEASNAAACMAALGYDPLEFYTGLAPLEALALSIPSDDREVVFRCDLVTVSEGKLVDPTAGNISPREAEILFEAVSEGFRNKADHFFRGSGHRNYLVAGGPERVDDLDEADCVPPQKMIGHPIEKFFPKGKASDLLVHWIRKSREILENHEVNRVRIDLGENPANQLWFWGQGRKPKMPSFKQQHQLEGSVSSNVPFMQGLGTAAGMASSGEADFSFAYFPGFEAEAEAADFRKKIKHLEDFDSKVVKTVVQKMESAPNARVCVTSAQGTQAPFLMWGQGIASEGAAAFDEKNCAQSKHSLKQGFKLMEEFLK